MFTPRNTRYFQSAILLLLAGLLLQKFLTGSLSWYIHQRFWPLTWIAIFGLETMSVLVASATWNTNEHAHEDHDHENEHEHDHDHDEGVSRWSLLFVALPLIVGILVPAHSLTSDMIDSKGMVAAAPLAAGGIGDVRTWVEPEARTILDWTRIFHSGQDVTPYLGQTASVSGFVYHDPNLKENQFMVSRFVVMCCAADAFAIGMAVEWPDAKALKQDGWVQARGPVQLLEYDGQKIPIIKAASIEPILQPENPYLNP